MSLLRVEKLSKKFHADFPAAVNDVSFRLEAGEIFALLGPSGCGKTTTLRMLAGFEAQDSGEIFKNEIEVSKIPAEKRGIGFVFQDWALFPHLSVEQNIAFGLRGWNKVEKTQRVQEVLSMVGLTIFKDRRPHQLSGGQQQRVALARAIAPGPSVILLDEPFSSLDAALRQVTRDEVRNLLKKAGVGTILVTHDQEEAFSFADRLAIMRRGAIEQIGTPEEVYEAPATAFVAQFLGRTNLISGDAKGWDASTALGKIGLTTEASGAVLLSLRPEDITLLTPSSLLGNLNDNVIEGTVLSREFKGHDLTFKVKFGDRELIAQESPKSPFRAGDRVRIVVRSKAVVVSKN